ncbi:DEAD/DEAH box helicase [Nonlabens tegetincola]|uniref:DEAD/DEAH box helicase n=1 Tax=Nonlabens tegetincola TaxID=323273 RepID=UPI000CF4F573|nr:DEAD/DEAH box helicase [Nonlabens tegetincola]PQJ18451.1 hypothetical protein BST93_08165 [Nonlabens tegetincola]
MKEIGAFRISGGKRDSYTISNDLKFRSGFTDDFYTSVKITFNHGSLWCLPHATVIAEDDGILRLKEQVARILKKRELSTVDRELYRKFSQSDLTAEFEDREWEQFQKELVNVIKSDTEHHFEPFVKKWLLLSPEWVNISTFRHLEKLNLYFHSWLDSKLPVAFFEEHIIEACMQYELPLHNNQNITELTFADLLNVDHKNIISSAICEQMQGELTLESLEIYRIYKLLIKTTIVDQQQVFFQKINNSIKPDFRFELWLNNEIEEFPKEYAIIGFSDFNVEVQTRILKKLNVEEIQPLIKSIKEVKGKEIQKKVSLSLINHVSSLFNYVCFDLESNGEQIGEIGWVGNSSNQEYFNNQNNIEEGIKLFSDCITNSDILLVGHNIVEWDIPILNKNNASVFNDQVWDTFQIEMFLSPEFKTFALKTEHTALSDAKLTRNLFLNQLCRILFSDERLCFNLFSFLPDRIIEKINVVKNSLSINWSPLELLNEDKKTYFRSQPNSNQLLAEVIDEITDTSAKKVLIIGDDNFKNEVIKINSIAFHAEESISNEFYRLDDEKVSEISDDLKFEKLALLNVIAWNKRHNRETYFGQIPTSLRITVENKLENFFEYFKPLKTIDWFSDDLIYLTVNELISHKKELEKLKSIHLITVKRDLISIENKQLLKEIDLDFMMRELDTEDYFWLKFSGGQSFSSISAEQCKRLEVEVPQIFDNIWVEKISLSNYRVWGNYNWESLLEDLNINSTKNVTAKLNTDSFDTVVAQVNSIETLNNKVIRYNPESLYRSRYWVFQKQLVEQIILDKKSSILFVQRRDEIKNLENYFQNLKYYIPNRNISLGRRLELLHHSSSQFKLIIAHISEFDTVVRANYLGDINFIIDSFRLAENNYSAFNSTYYKKLLNKKPIQLNENVTRKDINVSNNDITTDGNRPTIRDSFFLLELLKPTIDSLRYSLKNIASDHRLWLLDPRLNDHPEIFKKWKLGKKVFRVWDNLEKYQESVKEADLHFDSIKPILDIPLDNERIKDIIKQIFLKGYDWRESQKPYLELILKREQDQLITLPTGEGKSVLFQGPALYRGAFTNRLTVVITPLKALMEDQVDALWNKGFYGSVDYINSDRSSEVYSIYRAIAGGELSLLFVTPERFRSRSFNSALQMRIQSDGGLEYAVFDEAHCVSQWGHEFRPDYFNCAKYITQLKSINGCDFPLLLFSATVSEKIYDDFNTIFS